MRRPGFARDDRGVAAIEGVFVSALLATALMNVIEVSRYAYISAQVAAATQAGAQAAAMACDTTKSPATTNCPALADAVDEAVADTSLGSEVSREGAIEEGWYCVNGQGALHYEGGPGSKPSSCGGSAGAPGLYLKVSTTYAFEPIFPGLTIAAAFSDNIERTAWMRML